MANLSGGARRSEKQVAEPRQPSDKKKKTRCSGARVESKRRRSALRGCSGFLILSRTPSCRIACLSLASPAMGLSPPWRCAPPRSPNPPPEWFGAVKEAVWRQPPALAQAPPERRCPPKRCRRHKSFPQARLLRKAPSGLNARGRSRRKSAANKKPWGRPFEKVAHGRPLGSFCAFRLTPRKPPPPHGKSSARHCPRKPRWPEATPAP